MSLLIGGIPMGQQVIVRLAGSRYRDMYGGAVSVEVTLGEGHEPGHLHLTAPDALALADDLREAARQSAASYEAAMARRGVDPGRRR